jgi:hypothetical protein
VIALISINKKTLGAKTLGAKTLGAKTLGAKKNAIRIRVRKNEVAAGLPACGTWRRSVIDYDLFFRHRTKSTMLMGRRFSQIVAKRASLPQLWRKYDYAQGVAWRGRGLRAIAPPLRVRPLRPPLFRIF